MIEGITADAPKVIRRTALKAGVVAAGAVAFGIKEITAGKNGIETSVGIFYPLYEDHRTGLNPENIPDDLDAYFKEGTMNKSLYEADPIVFIGPRALTRTLRRSEVLEKLAGKKIKLIMGDTDIYVSQQERGEPNFSDNIDLKLANDELIIAYGLFVGGGLSGQIKKLLDGARKHIPSKKELSRRKLIRNSLIGVAAYIALPMGSFVSGGTARFTMDLNQMNATERILVRLEGIGSHLHPEIILDFFRNLIMADKILTVAETLQKQTGKKPKVGFNVGSAHAGIEDLLAAGSDFCRTVISFYPTDFLKKIVGINGSIENLATARVISMPTNLKSSDLVEGKNARDLGVSEQKVVDIKLVNLLTPKLAEIA